MKLIRAAARTSRHPTRSTILAAIAAALATIALVVASSGNPAEAASSLVNGNFETGDLTGWTADTTNGGYATAVHSFAYPNCNESGICGLWYGSPLMLPKEGSYFALIYSGISQPFEASNGDKVSGWAFVNTDSLFDPSYDMGQVVIKSDSGTTVATPFEQTVGTGGNPYWKYWEYTFSGVTGTGTFQIEARIQKSPSSPSGYMGLDDVKTSRGDPDATAPAVTDVVPTDGEQNVAIGTNVEATFSEAMDASTSDGDASTIDGTTFTLTKPDGPDADTDPDAVAGAVSYYSANKKATLDPTADLDYSTTYTATVTTGAEDLAGNPLAADEVWTFTTAAASQDTAPPETTIDSKPEALTNSTSASFSFSSNEAGSSFECKLDSPNFTSCTSPQNYSNLSDGLHTFQVRATDVAGNVDATPDSYSWTVDTKPPETTITPSSGATGVPRTTMVTAQFSEDVDGATVTTNTFMLGKGQLSSSQLTDATRIRSGTTVSYEPSNKTATLDPYGSNTTTLARCQWYTAKVTSGVKDKAGNSALERMWTFKTRGC
jgi:Bacterial Ig-like domain